MIWSYYIYVCVFTNWKLYNIAAHIDRHVSCLLKNVNIIQFFFFIPSWFCIIEVIYFFPFCWTLFQLLQKQLSVRLGWVEIFSLFAILAYFCYYLWVPLHVLILFMSPIVLFSLFFNLFFYTFSKKFSISTK